jgi:peptide/nickel transport system substrate-binding protein
MRLCTLAAAVLLAVAVASCGPAREEPDGVITLAVPSSPNNLDPRVGSDEVSQKIHQLVFSTLLALDERLQVGPGLASGWTTPTPTTYVVTLRRGVRFHDGHELTSDDVVHTFRSFLAPDFISPRKGAYRMLSDVRAIDRYTVEFVLKEPFGSFPINLVMPIVPEDATAALRDRPVGTGPYRFVSFAADDRVVLAPFQEFHGGAPRNDGVVIKVVPDDTMRGLELRKGAIDLVVNDLAPDIVHQLREEPGLQVVEGPGTDYAYAGINLRDPVLRDVRVRQALSHAVDRAAIVEHLRRGLAEPAVGILPPMSWAFTPDVATYPHDPARARALLDEAGYPDPDGDGPQPRLHLTLKVSSTEFNRLQSSVLQQDFARVGVALDVRTYEFATLYADVLKGNFQLYTLQWVGVSDPDMLRRVFHTRQMPPNGFNRGFFSDPEFDALIDRATVSVDDAERTRLYTEAQRLISREVPYISLWYKTNVAVAQRALTGLRLSPSADFLFLRNVTRTDTSIAGRPTTGKSTD